MVIRKHWISHRLCHPLSASSYFPSGRKTQHYRRPDRIFIRAHQLASPMDLAMLSTDDYYPHGILVRRLGSIRLYWRQGPNRSHHQTWCHRLGCLALDHHQLNDSHSRLELRILCCSAHRFLRRLHRFRLSPHPRRSQTLGLDLCWPFLLRSCCARFLLPLQQSVSFTPSPT